jgi:uncharacterized membrane protein YgcG
LLFVPQWLLLHRPYAYGVYLSDAILPPMKSSLRITFIAVVLAATAAAAEGDGVLWQRFFLERNGRGQWGSIPSWFHGGGGNGAGGGQSRNVEGVIGFGSRRLRLFALLRPCR